MDWFLLTFTAVLAALLVAGVAAFLLRSAVLNWVVDRTVVRMVKDPYVENLWDLMVGMTRVPPHMLMELELRAESGASLQRPLGTVRSLPSFAGVAFNPAQLIRPPAGPRTKIDLTTVLGPRAKCPLRLEMPLLVAGMGYGVALSKPFVLGLARGASRAGTCYNAGSGPVLDEILRETRLLILQYTGGRWNREREVLAQADMIEIRYGHGGRAALGSVIPYSKLPPEARELMGLRDGEEAIVEVPLPGGATPAQLKQLVPDLRGLIEGRPVGVKLAATHDLERELEAVLEAGADVIAIDGAQAGTHGGPPLIADEFGIPTVHALHRAVRFLERTGSRKDVSLIVGGGLLTPGDFLKALALGADAVYVGTAAMMAGTHGQLSRVIPFEPITQLCWADGKVSAEFDPEKGAQTVANFLTACAGEMAEGLRALGWRSVGEISRRDLIARDMETAAVLGLPPSWRGPGER